MSCLQRRFISVFFFLALTALIPSETLGDGLVLGPAWSIVSLCSGDYCDGASGATGISDALDLSYGDEYGSWSLSMAAATYFGENPMVDVMWAASQNQPLWSDSYRGSASLGYHMGIEETAPPPEPVVDIPVTVSWKGSAHGEGFWQYNFLMSLGGASSHYPLSGVASLEMAPGYDILVTLSVSCSGGTNGAYPHSECQVVVDPVFEFDQAAFDAQMGGDTFPLADYYGFGYSPNLITSPDPSSLILLGIGMLGLAGGIRSKLL